MSKPRGLIRPTTREEAVRRAIANMMAVPTPPPGAPPGTLPQPIGYRLDGGHNGGNDPYADHCAQPSFGDRVWTADCAGFVLHSLGIDRAQAGPDGKIGTDDDYEGANGLWLNTKSILADADGARLYFEPIEKADAIPGDVFITPGEPGHIEMVLRKMTAVSPALLIGCSPRHDPSRKAAIGVATPWALSCRALRYKRFKV